MKLSSIATTENLDILENVHNLAIDRSSLKNCMKSVLVGLDLNPQIWNEFNYSAAEKQKLQNIIENGFEQFLEILVIENQEEWDENDNHLYSEHSSRTPSTIFKKGDIVVNSSRGYAGISGIVKEVIIEDDRIVYDVEIREASGKPLNKDFYYNDTWNEQSMELKDFDVAHSFRIITQWLDEGEDEGMVDCIQGTFKFYWNYNDYLMSFKYYEDGTSEIFDLENKVSGLEDIELSIEQEQHLESLLSKTVNTYYFRFSVDVDESSIIEGNGVSLRIEKIEPSKAAIYNVETDELIGYGFKYPHEDDEDDDDAGYDDALFDFFNVNGYDLLEQNVWSKLIEILETDKNWYNKTDDLEDDDKGSNSIIVDEEHYNLWLLLSDKYYDYSEEWLESPFQLNYPFKVSFDELPLIIGESSSDKTYSIDSWSEYKDLFIKFVNYIIPVIDKQYQHDVLVDDWDIVLSKMFNSFTVNDIVDSMSFQLEGYSDIISDWSDKIQDEFFIKTIIDKGTSENYQFYIFLQAFGSKQYLELEANFTVSGDNSINDLEVVESSHSMPASYGTIIFQCSGVNGWGEPTNMDFENPNNIWNL